MQNQPIIAAAPPVTPANPIPPAGNASGSNTATAETFGSVLARQRDNIDSAEIRDGKQATAPTGDAPTGNDATDAAQAVTADLLGMLPGDMLAVLVPTNMSGTNTDTEGKNTRKVRAIEQDALRAQSLASDASVSALTVNGMTAPPMVMPVALQGIPSDQPTRSAATGTPDIAALPLAAGPEVPVQPRTQSLPLATGEIMTTTLPQSKLEPTSTAQFTVTTGTTTQTNLALDALKSVRAEEANVSPLAAALHSGNSALAPQPDISSGVNITPQIAAIVATQPGAPAQVTVNTPVGRDTWANDFNQSITWLATRQEQSAQLHLNPPNLGPLDVVLKISDGQATALFTSPHAAVREAVEQALPRLREMLADSGITLGNAMVSDQSPKDQQAGFTNNQLKGGANVSDKVIGMPSAIQSAESAPERRHQGMVDTFA